MGKVSSLFNIPINWKGVAKHLQELSDGPNLEKVVCQQMEVIIKQQHPGDYKKFMEDNAEELNRIKEKMIVKYSLELDRMVSGISQLSENQYSLT